MLATALAATSRGEGGADRGARVAMAAARVPRRDRRPPAVRPGRLAVPVRGVSVVLGVVANASALARQMPARWPRLDAPRWAAAAALALVLVFPLRPARGPRIAGRRRERRGSLPPRVRVESLLSALSAGRRAAGVGRGRGRLLHRRPHRGRRRAGDEGTAARAVDRLGRRAARRPRGATARRTRLDHRRPARRAVDRLAVRGGVDDRPGCDAERHVLADGGRRRSGGGPGARSAGVRVGRTVVEDFRWPSRARAAAASARSAIGTHGRRSHFGAPDTMRWRYAAGSRTDGHPA